MRRTSVVLAVLITVICAGYYGFSRYGDRLGLTTGTPQIQEPRRAAAVIPVKTVAAEQGAFPVRRRSIGLLESPAVVVVRSRIDSQMLEKHVTDGQLVREGDLLFTLDDRELRATIARNEAQLAKDEAARDRANADLKRTEELLSRNVATRQLLDEKIAEAKAAEATIAADKAQLESDRVRLGYTKIVAPITGRIGAIRVTPGNLVSSSDSQGLVTITQIKPIRVSFTLPERDLGALRAAIRRKEPPVVRVYAAGNSQPLATGQLDFVDSSVDPATGTIMAKATFDNEDYTLWPGMYVDVEIDLDIRPDTVSIPTVALQTSQKGPFVFVARPDGTAELRQVETGGLVGDRSAIRSGLAPGERVVIEGQLRLADGARIRDAAQPGDAPGPQAPAPASEKSAAQRDAVR